MLWILLIDFVSKNNEKLNIFNKFYKKELNPVWAEFHFTWKWRRAGGCMWKWQKAAVDCVSKNLCRLGFYKVLIQSRTLFKMWAQITKFQRYKHVRVNLGEMCIKWCSRRFDEVCALNIPLSGNMMKNNMTNKIQDVIRQSGKRMKVNRNPVPLLNEVKHIEESIRAEELWGFVV